MTDLRHEPRAATADPLFPSLTGKQVDVLRMAAQGLTNAAISRERGTSERSVEMLMHSVFQTLGIAASGDVNPRVEAVRQYIDVAGLPVRQ
jgi:DNA-binding NarL/FixJ family response regulator